jgi:hypothetical protein
MSIPLILQLDKTGQTVGWINWQNAANLYAKEAVSWTMGDNVFRVYGGYSRLTERRSFLDLHSIIATYGVARQNKFTHTPPLSNHALFRRDQHICMYCLSKYSDANLSRDHVIPLGQGGTDQWTNVVTACKWCNQKKGCKTPQQAGMKLYALPYAPNYAEWLVLRNRRILSDQMEFLKAQFPKESTRV